MTFTPRTIGRYTLERPLGRGGMGSLYVAKDHLDRLVAVKLLHRDMDHDRFEREARAMAALQHKNIVHIYDYGEDEGAPYIVMEYLRGETLSELIHRKAPLSLSTKLTMIEELCDGLGEAHAAGIIHRDIKPANLMWAKDTLKVLDFGIARVVGSETRVSASGIVGTTGYLSPEQIRGAHIDHRTDLFSVGAVFYELLSYSPAFYVAGDTDHTTMDRILRNEPRPLASLSSDIGPQIVSIVNRALEKDVARRFPDATTLRRETAAARKQHDRLPATRLIPRNETVVDPEAQLNARLLEVEARLQRNQLTPAEALLSDMTREYPASAKVDVLWEEVRRKRLEHEQHRLVEVAAESACQHAESAISEGAFGVAIRYADEALVQVAGHEKARRLRAAAAAKLAGDHRPAETPDPGVLLPTEVVPTPGRARDISSDARRASFVSPPSKRWRRLAGLAAALVAATAIGIGLVRFGGTPDEDLPVADAREPVTEPGAPGTRRDVSEVQEPLVVEVADTVPEDTVPNVEATGTRDGVSVTRELVAEARDLVTAGQWQSARERLQRVLDVAPDHREATAGMVQAFVGQGLRELARRDWSAAERSCNNAREYAPRDASALACVEEAAAGSQRDERAVQAATQQREVTEVLARAQRAHESRNLAVALELYGRVLTLDESSREAGAGRERVIIDQGRVRRYVRQASAAETAGDLNRAVTLMEAAAALDASPSVQQELARLSEANRIISRQQ